MSRAALKLENIHQELGGKAVSENKMHQTLLPVRIQGSCSPCYLPSGIQLKINGQATLSFSEPISFAIFKQLLAELGLLG